MATNKVQTLQEIVDTIYPPTPELVKQLLSPREIVLFIGRQKEGKSTLALQLAIDISRGEPFLGRFDTSTATVLYLDYENRFHRLKERAVDLVGSVRVDNLYVKGFDRLHQRDAALFGPHYDRLKDALVTTSADVLLIDPLRYAINKPRSSGTTDETLAVEAIDQIAALQQQRPLLATILVHHLKKSQNPRQKVKLKDDPHSWIDQIYGSQALLGHADSIWGLEQDDNGYVFATVPRSHAPIIIGLEKHPDSERFLLSPQQNNAFTAKQLIWWMKLPKDFSYTDAFNIIKSSNTTDRIIRRAMTHALLTKDQQTKRYYKV